MESSSGHVLLQELREQPNAVRETIEAESHELDQAARLIKRRRIHFLGMGSSYFASLYASYLLAEVTHNVAVNHVASEFIHYPSAIASSEVSVALSQSGESIETVEAVRLLKKKGRFVVGVTNEPKSALARLSDRVVLTHAGRERASSTKTFASTLAILYCLMVALAARTKEISERRRGLLLERMMRMTRTLDASLDSWNDETRLQSNKLVNCRAAMILARGPNLPAALQGALLLKEVAKIPAEGMSSGEFAHGPIEALSRRISVVVLGGGRTSKLQYRLALRSKALHARALMITPAKVRGADSISYGEIDENLAVFPCAVLLELLAYHTALKKRLNPDQFKVIHKVTTRE
jgi:glucosamine--fructose-6-phosphate aminotransferase (isomerizing)